jgi:hypothetical protein
MDAITLPKRAAKFMMLPSECRVSSETWSIDRLVERIDRSCASLSAYLHDKLDRVAQHNVYRGMWYCTTTMLCIVCIIVRIAGPGRVSDRTSVPAG